MPDLRHSFHVHRGKDHESTEGIFLCLFGLDSLCSLFRLCGIVRLFTAYKLVGKFILLELMMNKVFSFYQIDKLFTKFIYK